MVALLQVSWSSWGYPFPGSFQGHIGWGSEEPGLVKGVLAHDKELEQDDL